MRFTRVIIITLALLPIYPVALLHGVAAQETISTLPPATEDQKMVALRQQILGYYNEMDRATERLDMDRGFKYIAPDCKIILRDGSKVSVKFIRENATALYRRSVKTQIKTEITQFSMKGDTATAETRSTALMRLKNDTGIESDLDAVGQTRDFWMKTKNGWRIKQTRESDRTIKINGQIIQE